MSKSIYKKEQTDPVMNRLAIILKEERITNRALAAKIGYKETTISKWANNLVQPPLSTFLRIALLINRDLKDFFISTKGIGEDEKKKLLKELSVTAERGKRTGKAKK